MNDLKLVKFGTLHANDEFWKPLAAGHVSASPANISGPYYVCAETGHVLNKLFQLKKRLGEYDLMHVAFDPEREELFLMDPADLVYVRVERG